MKVFENIKEISAYLKEAKTCGKKIALVPTMGALHEGHLALIREAKKLADFVIVSIFVNKAQFNDTKDYKKYPRSVDSDLAKLQVEKIDIVFLPKDEEIYPNGVEYKIKVGAIGDVLCGVFRKNHFDGVALIITKLFEIIKPDFAVFGKKDFQQFLIIKKLAKNFNVEVIGIETIREKSGLAMSSRNQHLSESQKEIAANIFEILNEIKNAIKTVENIEKLLQNKKEKLLSLGFEKIDYLEIRDEENLELLSQKFDFTKKYRIFLAIYLNNVRLIDNLKV
ncbi:MAG TPA: pantoate--beta-alanine ligase [Rickettsiales bacterium]|nr:pantoate--beta-alanine ligase [Rickettsiales bacterium]